MWAGCCLHRAETPTSFQVAPDPGVTPHHFNLNVSDEIHWVNTPTMAAALGVSSRTLHSYLHKSTSPFIEGRHYRRQSPAPKSPWIWDKTLTVKAWSAELEAA